MEPRPPLEAVIEPVAFPLAVFSDGPNLEISNSAFRGAYEQQRALVDAPVALALQGRSVKGVELDLGGRLMLLDAAPVRRKRGGITHAVVTLHDVTEQRRAEAALREHETQLDASNAELRRSNEELQHFAFAVAHDLQEPLATMSGFCDRLVSRYSDRLGADVREYLRFISESSRHMKDMVAGLLAYARVNEAPQAESVCESDAALRWAFTQLETHLQASGGVICAEPLPPVAFDFERLTRIFENLLTNAVLYRGSEPPRIQITAEPDGEQWRFCVADNGVGIRPEYHERVFRIFKRLHGREIPGAGVGLALCRRIVELEGGRMWVEPEPGHGSRFYFTLPKAERAARRAAAG